MLISYLVRVACFQIAVQPVWEGLAERRWTESQLQELGQLFQHYDFPADLEQSLKAEKTYTIQELDYIKRKGLAVMEDMRQAKLNFNTYADFLDSVKPALHRASVNAVGRIAPAGWYEMERLNCCVLFDAQLKGSMDAAAARIFPAGSRPITPK